MRTLNRNLALGLLVGGILCGCSSGQDSGDGARLSARAAAARKAAKAPDILVSAVPASKNATFPVQVKFDLKDRPDVGQPVDINLVILPTSASVDRISGKVQADDGLELVDGAQIPASDRPAEGVPIQHTIKVRPERDGIFTFSAVLTVDTGGQSNTETYSMPVIAGAGMPDLPASPGTGKPAPAPTAAGPPAGRPTTGTSSTLAASSAAALAAPASPSALNAGAAAAH